MPFPKHLTKKWGAEIGWHCEYPHCTKTWSQGFLMEAHHKIPTSMGGTDCRENWILLCLYHHELSHRLLAKMDEMSANLIHARLVRTNGRWK